MGLKEIKEYYVGSTVRDGFLNYCPCSTEKRVQNMNLQLFKKYRNSFDRPYTVQDHDFSYSNQFGNRFMKLDQLKMK